MNRGKTEIVSQEMSCACQNVNVLQKREKCEHFRAMNRMMMVARLLESIWMHVLRWGVYYKPLKRTRTHMSGKPCQGIVPITFDRPAFCPFLGRYQRFYILGIDISSAIFSFPIWGSRRINCKVPEEIEALDHLYSSTTIHFLDVSSTDVAAYESNSVSGLPCGNVCSIRWWSAI